MSLASQALRGVTWSREETDILLAMWAQPGMQDQIESNSRDHTAYETIAGELSKYGYRRTWIQVRVKLKNLTQWYKSIKQKKLYQGGNHMNKSQTRLFNRLDPILKGKPMILRENSGPSIVTSYTPTMSNDRTSVTPQSVPPGSDTVSSRERPQTYQPPNTVSDSVAADSGDYIGFSNKIDTSHYDGKKKSQPSSNSEASVHKAKYRDLYEDDHIPFIKRYMARLEAEGSSKEDQSGHQASNSTDRTEPIGTIIIKEETASEPNMETARAASSHTDEGSLRVEEDISGEWFVVENL